MRRCWRGHCRRARVDIFLPEEGRGTGCSRGHCRLHGRYKDVGLLRPTRKLEREENKREVILHGVNLCKLALNPSLVA